MAVLIERREWVHTREVVRFLMKQPDQISTTAAIAEALNEEQESVRAALLRLQKVGRVAEIHPGMSGMWHLE
jgi:predicted ArsR family transcriptional regulator